MLDFLYTLIQSAVAGETIEVLTLLAAVCGFVLFWHAVSSRAFALLLCLGLCAPAMAFDGSTRGALESLRAKRTVAALQRQLPAIWSQLIDPSIPWYVAPKQVAEVQR